MKAREPNRRLLWFWWLILIAIIALAIVLALKIDGLRKPAEQNQPGLYSVSQFIDGDTIAVNMNGTTEIIRMIGVDTPETHRPNTPVQCYGPQAADFTENFIGKKKVRLQADPLNTNRDRYDRLLRYVYLPDGTMLEEAIISQGYGFAYTLFPYQKIEEFKGYETVAKAVGRGLWTACQVITQSNGLKQTNPAP
ncbi:thermonuclease family protein [Candidatus Saccharibacteria bacterium]|nr:thermonuclease family protein [Candidatus Saccharibacteria bacterium]